MNKSIHEKNYIDQLARGLREGGWSVVREPRAGEARADLLIRRGPLAYAVEVVSAPEGRRDRLIPLLAQAILQVRAAASAGGVAPLAVVAAPRIPDRVADAARRFARDHAPDVAVGLVDLEGYRSFVGEGLEEMSSRLRSRWRSSAVRPAPAVNPFSDLNQWMLKVLLAPELPESLLAAPRDAYDNAPQLAEAAGVSAMSAYRFVRALRGEGFPADAEEEPVLRLVRREDLMRRWRAAAESARVREWPLRWILRGDPAEQIEDAARSFAQGPDRESRVGAVRGCLGMFAAADALGLGLVHGVPPHLYVDRYEPEHLRQLGLRPVQPGEPPDLLLRVPAAPESVFRGAVRRDGLPVADVLQVWLDVAADPSRGREQALHIERQLPPRLFGGAS